MSLRLSILVGAMFWVAIASAQIPAPIIYRAFSLKTAETMLQMQGSSCQDTNSILFSLAGITKPKAIVLDSAGDDMILLGECDPSGSKLTLDDWSTALRARFDHPEADPGVSIDPEEDNAPKADSPHYHLEEGANQRVRFFAGIENTAFGQTCFEADWLLKRICSGLETQSGIPIESTWQIRLDEAKQSRPQDKRIMARGWYYPVVNDVTVTKSVVLLESFRLGVFSQILFAKVNGVVVSDLKNFKDRSVDDFTKSFNEHFKELESRYESIRRLKGLTRLAALAKGVSQLQTNGCAQYFARDYLYTKVETKTNVQVLKVQDDAKTLTFIGGVSIKAFPIRSALADELGEAFASLVLRGRTHQQNLFWDVPVSAVDIAQIEQQQLSNSARQADGNPNDLFEHSMFLVQNGFTGEGRKQLTRLITAFPGYSPGYIGRGRLSLDEKDYEAAFADFTFAIHLSPQSAQAHFLRGLTALNQSRWSTAIFDFNSALQLTPNDPIIIFDKAVACDNSQRTEEAVAAYRQFVSLAHTNLTFDVSFSRGRIASLGAKNGNR